MATVADYQDAFAAVLANLDPALSSQPNTVNFEDSGHDYRVVYDGVVTVTIFQDEVEITQALYDAMTAPEQVVVDTDIVTSLGSFAP